MQSEEIALSMKVLREHGWSISALAREFALNWRTVKRELESPGVRQYDRKQLFPLNPAQLAHIERRLGVCPSIRGTDLHAELRSGYAYEGSYQTFQRQLRLLRPAVIHDPEIRFETGPGIQLQADWADLGLWRLGDTMVELYAMVAILGCSRAPAFRFATDRTRPSTFRCLVRCVHDLGGVTKEILTDRDPAFCIGATSAGAAILAPDWVELCELLGTVPKACRPYRAKTKGKVERMVRELKESFLPWLSGQLLPPNPTLDYYDLLVRNWIESRILPRRHRTTERIVGEAWTEERHSLRAIPDRIIGVVAGNDVTIPLRRVRPEVVGLEQFTAGEHVQVRPMSDYEVAQ